ncbi:MAG: HAD-IA family hydrolase [Terriglobia bacterium]
MATNGWDGPTRERAVCEFGLDALDFQDRHELVINAFELGALSLDDYLDRTVFYRPRVFNKAEFREFMFGQSRPFPEVVDLYLRLAVSGRYFMAALNNESTELNLHRIETFGLRRIFSIFFSSCFLGIKKPNDAIYSLALKMSQRSPEECLFIDDRELNVEQARQCGMQTIRCEEPTHLASQMKELGLEW